ncbi:hypothetical protein, partial [Stagnihabitans tardus]
DRFTPGRGQDAIAGEGGRDILLLTGTPTDYTATRDGDMVRITGTGAGQGVDIRFQGIELLGFVDPAGASSLMPLEDFLAR